MQLSVQQAHLHTTRALPTACPSELHRLQARHSRQKAHLNLTCKQGSWHVLPQPVQVAVQALPWQGQEGLTAAQPSSLLSVNQAQTSSGSWLLQPACQTDENSSQEATGQHISEASSPQPHNTPAQHLPATSSQLDTHYMQLALQQARLGASQGEIPVGCVLVGADGTVLATGHNLTHTTQNPLEHAEMRVISQAAERKRAWRLLGATLYSTLEPCPMCAGAILQARIGRLVYAARQPRLGADGSWVSLFPPPPDTPQPRKLSRIPKPFPLPGSPTAGSAPADPSAPPNVQGTTAASKAGAGAAGSDRDERQSPEAAVLKPKPHPFHNSIVVERGLLEQESAQLLKDFFRARRTERSKATDAAPQ